MHLAIRYRYCNIQEHKHEESWAHHRSITNCGKAKVLFKNTRMRVMSSPLFNNQLQQYWSDSTADIIQEYVINFMFSKIILIIIRNQLHQSTNQPYDRNVQRVITQSNHAIIQRVIFSYSQQGHIHYHWLILKQRMLVWITVASNRNDVTINEEYHSTCSLQRVIKLYIELPQQCHSRSFQLYNMVHNTQPSLGCSCSMNVECYYCINPRWHSKRDVNNGQDQIVSFQPYSDVLVEFSMSIFRNSCICQRVFKNEHDIKWSVSTNRLKFIGCMLPWL